MADSPSEPRAKRQRVDKVGRFAALEKLKQLKGDKQKNKYEVEEEVDNVYEIVDEKEYAKRAHEKYGNDWIEEDGTGYTEDGRDYFEDEDDYDSDEEVGITNKKNDKKPGGKKRARDDDKPAKGKGSIRNLFSNAVPKKKPLVSTIKDDDILADILGELDENPTETTKKVTKIVAPAKIVNATMKRQKEQAEKEYMDKFMQNLTTTTTTKTINKPIAITTENKNETTERALKHKIIESNKSKVEQNQQELETKEKRLENEVEKKRHKDAVEAVEREDHFSDNIDFECLHDVENQFEIEKEVEKKKAINQPKGDTMDMENLLNNWEKICQMEDFEAEVVAAANEAESSVVEDNLKFWYWEAWEDANKRPGEVFLFGRTTDGKSICVRVENIERVLYLLPREYVNNNYFLFI